MSLFGKLFSAKYAESVAFIEIGPDSIGGAYARYEEGKIPAIIYASRLPFVLREGEATPALLSRTLAQLGELMIREGAPALARAAGSGTADSVVVSIAAPWQEAAIRVEKFEAAKPFIFTRTLLSDALEHSRSVPEGRILADESVIATVLNGYEMATPYGKRVSRASALILTASVEASVAEAATNAVRALYHTHTSRLTAFTRVAYSAVRALFPHEEEYLVIETRAATTSVLLIKRNCLVGAMTIAPGAGDWITALKSALDQLSIEHPLPHTTFILAGDAEREALKAAIASAHFETLWLSEGAPRVIAVTPELTLPLAALAPEVGRDLFLSLLALSYKTYTHDEAPR